MEYTIYEIEESSLSLEKLGQDALDNGSDIFTLKGSDKYYLASNYDNKNFLSPSYSNFKEECDHVTEIDISEIRDKTLFPEKFKDNYLILLNSISRLQEMKGVEVIVSRKNINFRALFIKVKKECLLKKINSDGNMYNGEVFIVDSTDFLSKVNSEDCIF